MVLLLLVEVCNTLDGQIVGLCCARGEDDLLGIGTYERRHLDIQPTVSADDKMHNALQQI